MTLSIALMAMGSALIAVTPGYAAMGVWAPILLIVARLLQGFAVGGEVGPATMFMLEAAPPSRRMVFASWQLASQNLGSLVSGLLGVLLALALSKSSLNDWGWRVPFALGVLIAPVGVYIRSRLVETLDKARQTARAARAQSSRPSFDPIGSVFCSVSRSSAAARSPNIFSSHDPLCDPDASPAKLGGDAGHGHARDNRRRRGAGRRTHGGSLGPARGGDRAAHCPDDRAVSGDEVSHRQSERRDSGPGDHDPQPVARGQRRRRGDADPVDLPARLRATGLSIAYSVGVAIFGGTATYVVTWLVGVTGDPLASTYYVMAANVVMLLAVLSIRRADYDAGAWPPPVESEV